MLNYQRVHGNHCNHHRYCHSNDVPSSFRLLLVLCSLKLFMIITYHYQYIYIIDYNYIYIIIYNYIY